MHVQLIMSFIMPAYFWLIVLYLEVKYIRNTKQEETGRPNKEMGQTHKAFNIGFNFQKGRV